MITKEEHELLASEFSDVINYGADNPLEPIDPLSYVSPEGDTCLHIAVWRRDPEAIDMLCRAGIDVNAIGDMGQSALGIAAELGDAEICRLLLANGASTSVVDELSRTISLPR